jgi:hypothetical protein
MNVFDNIKQQLSTCVSWTQALTTVTRVTIPDKPAVYMLWTDTAFPRLQGHTNILYIGCTKRLGGSTDRARLYAYSYPSGPHAHLIKSRAAALINSGWSISLCYFIVQHKQDARKLENAWLTQHLQQHLELPPFNGKV